MEIIINKNIQEYLTDFKKQIQQKVDELNLIEKDKVSKLLEFVFQYESLVLTKNDIYIPKRVKIEIPCSQRCISKRVNGEQCTRRKSKDNDYCGTHLKVVRHEDFISKENVETKKTIKVYAENIQGIIYYIDEYLNVYNTEDILDEKEDPQIVAKAKKDGERYFIPEFNLF